MKSASIWGIAISLFVFFSAGHASDDLRACVEQVCGPASSIPSMKHLLKTFGESPSTFDNKIKTQVFPLIEKSIRINYQDELLAKNLLEKQGAEVLNRDLHGANLTLANFFFGLKKFGTYVGFLKSKDGSIVFNEELKADLLKIKKQEEIDSDLPIALLYANTKSYIDFDTIRGQPVWFIFAYLYKDLSLNEAIAADVKMVELKAKLISTTYPVLKPVLEARGAFLVAKNANSLDETSARAYVQHRFFVTLISEYLHESAFAPFRNRQTQMSEIIDRESINSKLKMLEVSTKPKFVTSKIELAKDTCLTSLRQAFQTRPSELAKKEMDKAIQLLRQDAVLAAERLSFLPRQQIESKVNAVNFYPPETSNQILLGVKEALDNQITYGVDLQRQSIPFSLENEFVFLGTLLNLMLADNDIDAESSNPAGICSAMAPPSFPNDFSMSGQAKVNISWQSFYYKGFGLSIVAHELGHAVYEAIDFSNAAQTLVPRVCLREMHLDSNSDRFLSEDFADAFAAKLIQKREGNFACGLLPKTGDGKDYDYKYITLANADANGPHSTYLFRALHWLSYFSSLPKECSFVLEASSKLKPDRCL